MFLPNTRCKLYRRSDTTDRRGEYTYAPFVSVPCSVIDLALKLDKTNVRADSSGSRGKATEEQGLGRILFPTYVTIKEGDIVEAEDEAMEVIGVYPRRDVLGKLDHKDVTLTKAQLP
jgi:hypothetical protein